MNKVCPVYAGRFYLGGSVYEEDRNAVSQRLQ